MAMEGDLSPSGVIRKLGGSMRGGGKGEDGEGASLGSESRRASLSAAKEEPCRLLWGCDAPGLVTAAGAALPGAVLVGLPLHCTSLELSPFSVCHTGRTGPAASSLLAFMPPSPLHPRGRPHAFPSHTRPSHTVPESWAGRGSSRSGRDDSKGGAGRRSPLLGAGVVGGVRVSTRGPPAGCPGPAVSAVVANS